MTEPPFEELLKLIWLRGLYKRPLTTCDGRSISILCAGNPNPEVGPEITDAQIEIDGIRYVGSIAIHARASQWHQHQHASDAIYNECILHLVEKNDTVICRVDGTPIPAVELHYPTHIADLYQQLTNSKQPLICGSKLNALLPVNRCEMLTRLGVERLERKCNDFYEMYEAAEHDWQEVFYIMLFRYLSGNVNQEAYTKLARKVRYVDLCRVREKRLSVEALLLGTAGLLDPESRPHLPDDYTLALQEEFNHLSRRFAIEPMRRGEWAVNNNRPHNHPATKLVELAALLSKQDFLFSKIINSTSVKEIQTHLSCEASEYWDTHFLPSQPSKRCVKRIGQHMLDIETINFAVPLIFTYGKIHNDDAMQEKAINLLEEIDFEQNGIINQWLASGLTIENAFFSQALIELTNEYCKKKRCATCNLGQRLLCSQN